MKKLLFMLFFMVFSISLCISETYLLNDTSTQQSEIRLTYYYDTTNDVFSIKESKWSGETPTFKKYLVFTKEQENILLNTIKKYKEWLNSTDFSSIQESIEKEIPNSKLTIDGTDYYFLFIMDYRISFANEPTLVIATQNKKGKKIRVHLLFEYEMNDIEKYFDRNFFNENKSYFMDKKKNHLDFIDTQCSKALVFLSECEAAINANDFEHAERLLKDVNDCIYEPRKADAVSLEYVNSTSSNPKNDLKTSEIENKVKALRKELMERKKKFETERIDNLLQ